MTTWLEVAVQRSIFRQCSSILDSKRLRVLDSLIDVIALANYATIVHNKRADERVRTRETGASSSELQRALHQEFVRVKHVRTVTAYNVRFAEPRSRSLRSSRVSLKS